MSPSDPHTGSLGVLIVGQDRGQLVEIALFWREVAGFLAEVVRSCEMGDIWPLDDGTRLALSVVESEM